MRTLPKATFTAAATALGAAALPQNAAAMIQCGMASWCALEAGTTAADGGAIEPSALAATHRSLPFGTRVRVENLSDGRARTVEISDRGPFTHGRVIDVTRAAAEELAFLDSGVARVRISTLEADAEDEASAAEKKRP